MFEAVKGLMEGARGAIIGVIGVALALLLAAFIYDPHWVGKALANLGGAGQGSTLDRIDREVNPPSPVTPPTPTLQQTPPTEPSVRR